MFFAFMRITVTFAIGHEPQKIDILQDWRGEYPVSEICRLPEGMRSSRIGYINDTETFTAVWQAFKTEDKTPEVDFKYQLVLFVRNVVFFNRIGIAAVSLKDGGAQVLAMETMSALPIEDRVSMALAVIPSAGVRYIAVGSQRIPVILNERGSSPDFLNATYMIAGQKISLHNGSSEKPVLPGSAARIITRIFGTPLQGDIDGDGDEDAVVTLVHHSGGSGTFYYVAAAINRNGEYQGTNTVLLGDRIFPQGIAIVNGIIVARYKDRRSHEPMTKVPSVEKRTYLLCENETLRSIKARESDEQGIAGKVIQ